MEDDTLCMTGFGFNLLMVNRTIPVSIAVYRYALVFYYDVMLDTRKKKMLQMFLAFYNAGEIEVVDFCPNSPLFVISN